MQNWLFNLRSLQTGVVFSFHLRFRREKDDPHWSHVVPYAVFLFVRLLSCAFPLEVKVLSSEKYN